jgi:hypothetical protein
MSKTVTMTLMFGALTAATLSSPAQARVRDAGDIAAQCRRVVQQIWPGYAGSEKDRIREFVFNSCVQNGGTLP